MPVWRSDASGGDPTEVIWSYSNTNNGGAYGAAVDRTINGEPGKLIVTVLRSNASRLRGLEVTVR